ncbi:MAG: acetylglutamate kinase, partial [Bacillota bacterium]
MDKIIKKAEVLIESLPYIRDFYGKTFIIKYGGSVLKDDKLRTSVIEDIILLKYVGVNPVIVHGGGPAITEAMKAFNKKSEFIDGLRVTD